MIFIANIDRRLENNKQIESDGYKSIVCPYRSVSYLTPSSSYPHFPYTFRAYRIVSRI